MHTESTAIIWYYKLTTKCEKQRWLYTLVAMVHNLIYMYMWIFRKLHPKRVHKCHLSTGIIVQHSVSFKSLSMIVFVFG